MSCPLSSAQELRAQSCKEKKRAQSCRALSLTAHFSALNLSWAPPKLMGPCHQHSGKQAKKQAKRENSQHMNTNGPTFSP